MSDVRRRVAHDDVEICGKFANLGFRDRREVHDHRFARLGVFDSFENHVLLISRLALDVALRRLLIAAFHFHREMNVRGAARVGDWFDSAEIIAAVGAS